MDAPRIESRPPSGMVRAMATHCVHRWFLLLLLALLPCTAAWSADERAPSAVLRLHGHDIAILRATLFGFTPDERAVRAVERLLDVLRLGGPLVVTSQPVTDGLLLSVDGQRVLLLVPEDADRLLGQSLDEVAVQAQLALTTAISAERSPLSGNELLTSLLRVLVATIVFIAGIIVLVLVRGWTIGLIVRIAHACARAVNNRDLAAFLQDQLVRSLRWGLLGVAWALGLLGGYVWLTVCLGAFHRTRDMGDELGFRLADVSLGIVQAVGQAIPQLAVILLIMIATGILAHVFKLFFARIEKRGLTLGWLNRDTAVPTRRIATVVLWLIAIAIAFPYVPGSNTDSFRGISVLVGLMASLGGASLVGQAASGFILTYLGTIRVGDYVIVGQTEGVVANIGVFTTRIETIFKEAVSIPNIFILSNTITNLSRFPGHDGFVLQAVTTIGYTVPWRRMHALLIEAAGRTAGLRSAPEPYVQQRALSDFYVEYHVCCHLENPIQRIPVLSDLYCNIQDLCNEQGIQILSPHFEHEPKQPAVVPREQWFLPPTAKPD